MSKYANAYKEVEPNINFGELFQYRVMMNGKRDMERFGARLLAEYKSRKKS